MTSESKRILELGDIIKTVTPPKKIQTSEFLETGDYPIVDQSPPNVAGWTNDATALVHPPKDGLIVFGDHTCVLKFETNSFAQGADGIKIIEVKNDINPHYVYAHLKAFPLLNDGYKRHFSELKRLKILIPDSNMQDYISEVHHLVDSKIASNIVLSKTLEEITQTIFKSWFIDFDPVKAKMVGETPEGMDAAIASLFPGSIEVSELGLIPKGWQVGSLFDFSLEIESGSRPKGGVKGISSGVPSIGAESINGLGVFDFSKTKFVPRDFYEKMNKGKPRDFDVLLYKDGGKPGEFKPRVGMYGLGFPFSEFAVNEHVFVLRSKELGNPYLYFWIRLERTLDILRSRGIKAAIPGINQQDVGTIHALKPPQEILKTFNELVFPSISKILTLATESLMLTTLRDTLMPRLISGELQIPEEMLAS